MLLKKTKKRIISVVLTACVMASALSFPAGATPTSQQKLNDANKAKQDAANKKQQAEAQANAISDDIVKIMASISILEDQLAAKKKELAKVQADLAEAQEKERTQNDAMKARIKSIYEKGNTAYLTAFLEARDFADLINKMEYASTIYEYDKTMLDNLRDARAKVQDLEQAVAAEAAELEGMVNECTNEKYNLQVKLDGLKKSITNYDAAIKKAEADAAKFKAQIEAENKQYTSNTGSGNVQGDGGHSNHIDKPNIPNDGTLGAQIVRYACQFIGNKYVWGGNDLNNGIDCSGFTQQVYGHFGISLPRWSGAQGNCGTPVSLAEAKAGDLIWYSGHVAIYMGNNQIVHASNSAPYPAGGIKVSSATSNTILSIRRLF